MLFNKDQDLRRPSIIQNQAPYKQQHSKGYFLDNQLETNYPTQGYLATNIATCPESEESRSKIILLIQNHSKPNCIVKHHSTIGILCFRLQSKIIRRLEQSHSNATFHCPRFSIIAETLHRLGTAVASR